MTDPSINPNPLGDLYAKAIKLQLTDAQKALFDVILQAAWKAFEEALEGEFAASFEQGPAQWNLDYTPGAPEGTFSIRGSIKSIRGSTKDSPHP